MARLIWLIRRWRLEAIRLRRRLAAAPPDAWMGRIRLRIRTFLLARYADIAQQGAPACERGATKSAQMYRFSVIRHPRIEVVDCPPRPRTDLLPLLRDIRSQNEAQRRRRRWRFWP